MSHEREKRREALNNNGGVERSVEGVGLIWSVSLCCLFNHAYGPLYIVGTSPSSFLDTR